SRRASGGAAAFVAGQANRGRHAQGRARAAAQRDRHRTRRTPRRAASAATRPAAQPLQPRPPPHLADARTPRDHPRAAHACPPHPRRHAQPRRRPSAQALPRPPPLPPHAEHEPSDDLTVIGASFSYGANVGRGGLAVVLTISAFTLSALPAAGTMRSATVVL